MRISLRQTLLLPCLIAGFLSPILADSLPESARKAVAIAEKSPKNKAANNKAGDALKDIRQYKEAIKYYLKGDNSGNLGAAESFFYLYDYDSAEEYLNKYLEKRSKAEEAKDKEFGSSDWTEYLQKKIDIGKAMLDRVEKIEIVDSINVPADEFFKFYKLAKSAGRFDDELELENIVTVSNLKELGVTNLWAPAHLSESGDDVIWYGSTDDGDSKMFESTRLADGNWDEPVELFNYRSIFGDDNGSWVSYPFLMTDGVTLYFAADGENSLGELDIFISRRDSDGFLQPSNIGMPYNSPYNDYLYAIDEENHIGWWATDRNQLKDSVTIYTFIPKDLRINYPIATPRLIDYAKISSIAITQDKDSDYDNIRRKIASLDEEQTENDSDDFAFALPGGKIITSMSQLSNQQSVAALKEYLSAKKSYKKQLNELAKMRKSYASKSDRSTAEKILTEEKTIEAKKIELLRLKNRVVKCEMQ